MCERGETEAWSLLLFDFMELIEVPLLISWYALESHGVHKMIINLYSVDFCIGTNYVFV